MALSACGGGGDGLKKAEQLPSGANDINPQDPQKLRDGGELRFPVDQLPDNYNYNQVDGTLLDGAYQLWAMMPYIFPWTADGGVALNTDYVTSAELISTDPQAVTYKINPKATWSDGAPITWEDFKAQAEALSGKNKEFQVSSTTGYEDIQKVEKGADDREVKVAFAKKFGDWKALFSPLYPKSLNSDPKAFNEGWKDTPLVTAGPFKIEKIDQAAKTTTMVRDEKWWGTKPRLERIIFRVIARNTLADALANNEIDFYQIGSSVDLFQRAKQMQGVVVRQGLAPTFNHLTFNGAPGSLLSDQKLRVAIHKGINRQIAVEALIGKIMPNPKPLNSHMFVEGNKNYKDNSSSVAYNPDQARKELDELGWKQEGEFRKKDGKELLIRLVQTAGNPISEQILKVTQAQLKEIGVKGDIQPVPSSDFFKEYVNKGNFDVVGFGWSGTPFPISDKKSIYALAKDDVQQNYGRIGSEELNKLFEQANSELDEAKRVEIAQKIDEEIWKSGHSLPLYQVPGAYAVRGTLANLGARGSAQIDFAKVGFTS